MFRKLVPQTAFLAASIAALTGHVAHAMPSQEIAYQNDDLGVVVYKDARDPAVYWYLPLVKLYEQGGRTMMSSRMKAATAKLELSFFLVPYFPDSLFPLIANELPNLRNRNQLRPVVATKFAVQVKRYGVVPEALDGLTNVRYLNQPQLVSFEIDPTEEEDFKSFFSAAPGVPANVVLYYMAEGVEKYLDIKMSCKEVYKALNIGLTGQYMFAGAEIKNAVTKYVANEHVRIRSKGDIAIDDGIKAIIARCFTPVKLAGEDPIDPYQPGCPPGSPWCSPFAALEARPVSTRALFGDWTGIAAAGNCPPLDPFCRPLQQQPEQPGSGGGLGDILGDAKLRFVFKREKADQDEKFDFLHESMINVPEVALIPTFLSELPAASATHQVTELAGRGVKVGRDASAASPVRTGLIVRAGDQWVMNAGFTLSVQQGSLASSMRPIFWDATWERPESSLFYRVGNGPWTSVGLRASVGINEIQQGELQFYQDREAIFAKIPEKFRKNLFSRYTYAKTFPEFTVSLTGLRIQRAR